MIIELIHSRGLTLLINSQRPLEQNWSIGEEDDALQFRGKLGSDRGLTFGDLEVTGLTYDTGMEAFGEGENPATLTLTTNKGPLTAKITQITNGTDEDPITLADGTEQELDETQTYVRAEAP